MSKGQVGFGGTATTSIGQSVTVQAAAFGDKQGLRAALGGTWLHKSGISVSSELSYDKLNPAGMLDGDYTREALKRGLVFQDSTGANLFKFGVIGATDSHTGLARSDENNFYGKFTNDEPSKNRANDRFH